MNSLEKRSFYSFLLLYIISSFLFILLSGFWYYIAQKSSLESNDYFQMRHISDRISSAIIQAHMQELAFNLPMTDQAYTITLIDRQGNIVYGSLTEGFEIEKYGYFQQENSTILIADTPQGHLNISDVVVQSSHLYELLHTLKITVIAMMALIASGIVLIAWILSRLFMRPIHKKIDQIETFIKDVTHELNTPITALSMATERAVKKEKYDKKALRNISISTKQLFDIYTSLTYLNFSQKKKETALIDLNRVLLKSIEYYRELCESKRIDIDVKSESLFFVMAEHRANMLFGNLISNAIKYSMPNSQISITLREGIFTIQDHGVGIAKERLSKIFDRYNRETEYAGGFGVGLSIVQNICVEHHIEIAVRSEKEKGTVFTLTFSDLQ